MKLSHSAEPNRFLQPGHRRTNINALISPTHNRNSSSNAKNYGLIPIKTLTPLKTPYELSSIENSPRSGRSGNMVPSETCSMLSLEKTTDYGRNKIRLPNNIFKSKEILIRGDNESRFFKRNNEFLLDSINNTRREAPDADNNVNMTKLTFSKAESLSNIYSKEPLEAELKAMGEKVQSLKTDFSLLTNVSLSNDEINNIMKNCITYNVMALEKVYSKYTLFPETERILMKAVLQAELSVLKFMKSIKKYVDQILQEKELFSKKSQKAIEDIKAIRQQNSEALKGFLTMTHGFEAKEIKGQIDNIKKQTEQQEMIWNVEKQRLLAQIDQLVEKVNYYETEHPFAKLDVEYKQLKETTTARIKALEMAIEKKTNRIYKLEIDYSGERAAKDQLQKEKDILQNQHNELLAKYELQTQKYEIYFEQANRYRETAHMMLEDFAEKQEKYDKLLDLFQKTRVKYIEMQSRLDRIKREQGDNAAFSEEVFEEDVSLLTTIKEVFMKNRHPIIYHNLQKVENPTVKVHSLDLNLENLNLAKYSYYRPTFFAFIQTEYEDKVKNGYNVKAPISLTAERDFVAMVRAIFDSKFNEFLYYDNPRVISSFPDFVYGWLSTYQVCPLERKVKIITSDDKIDIEIRRLQFYTSLMNPKLTKVWDVVTFRECIEEKFSPDELFFFLYCRYILFEGSQLDHFASTLNIVHWISLDKAERLVDAILRKLDQDQLYRVKYHLRVKAKMKHKKQYLDSGFVLRVLLEYYRHDKKINFKMLQETFLKISTIGPNKKMTVTFDAFKQFIHMNYPFISDFDKARLYREAWCLGNGVVDHEVFYIAASESNFFIKILLHQYFMDIPYINYDKPTLLNKEFEDLSTKMIIKFELFHDIFKISKQLARSLGIEALLMDIEEYEKFFMKKSVDNLYKGESLYVRFSQLLQIYQKVTYQYYLIHKNSCAGMKKLKESEIESIKNLLSACFEYENANIADNHAKTLKLKKFQKMIKKKITTWLKMVGNIKTKVKDESSTKRESEADEKDKEENPSTESRQNTKNSDSKKTPTKKPTSNKK